MSLSKITLAFVSLAIAWITPGDVGTANAQVVTSYYGAPVLVPASVAPTVYQAYYAPPVATSPVVTSPVIGVIPVRSGLFGWRTTYVPVLAPATLAPATLAPANFAPSASYTTNYPPSYASPTYGVPYGAARPVIGVPSTIGPAYGQNPGAVVQSGYRGIEPATSYLPPSVVQSTNTSPAPPTAGLPFYAIPSNVNPPAVPYNAQPGVTFSPGSVMTMQ
jgi:hypothetical protein